MNRLTRSLLVLFIALLSVSNSFAQLPNPCIVGYWENWVGTNFIRLEDVDERYNVICVAFAEGTGGTDYNLTLNPPSSYNQWIMQNEIAGLQAEGRKIILSIGGANDPVVLDSDFEKTTFVSSVGNILDTYGFDGIDIDLEGSSLNYSNITVDNPSDQKIVRMIDGIKDIMTNYQATHGKKLILTMAPETVYVQGALSNWTGDYKGAYLPIIEALRDDIDMMNVQLYNSGDMYGLNGAVYKQGTADFIVAMTEAVILGFDAVGSIGTYSGLPAVNVGVGLPDCGGSGWVDPLEVEKAINYLRGVGPKAGSYTLQTAGGYPDLRGMMIWSINGDKACSPQYDYVRNYEYLFTEEPHFTMYNENPINEGEEDGGVITIDLAYDTFVSSISTSQVVIYGLPSGVSLGSVTRVNDTIAHLTLSGSSAYGSYTADIEDLNVYVTPSALVLENQNLNRNTGVVLSKVIELVPGKIESENYYSSVALEEGFSLDAGGGYKIMMREVGDEVTYKVLVSTTSEYELGFRVASKSGGGVFTLEVDDVPILSNVGLPTTNSWTNWQNTTYYFGMDAGVHTITIKAVSGEFDLNWMEFATTTGFWEGNALVPVSVYPNPANESITIAGEYNGNLTVFDYSGKVVLEQLQVSDGSTVNTSALSEGVYNLRIDFENGSVGYQKLIIE